MYLETFQPVGFLELELVDELIACKWRQRRNWATETATVSLEMEDQYEEVSSTFTNMNGATRIALAVGELHKSTRLDLLARYETHLHRMYLRTLKRLMDIQDKRKRDGISPVNPELSDPLPPNDEKLRNELVPQRYEPAPPDRRNLSDPVTLVSKACAAPQRRPVTNADWQRREPLLIPATTSSRSA
jgi:hypothetical protein